MSVKLNDDLDEERTVTETRYIEAKLSHSNRIRQLRDKLFEKFIASNKYRKVEPHITILPPFTIPQQKVHPLTQKLDTLPLKETPVTINGLSVWPSLNNPRVILLDVTVALDLSYYRKELLDILHTAGAKIKHEPVSAHITLFKADNGHEIKESSKDQLREFIWANREQGPWSTTIEYIDIPLTE